MSIPISLTIAGVDKAASENIRPGSVSIQRTLKQASSLSFQTKGYIPTLGETVVLTDEDSVVRFSGIIWETTQHNDNATSTYFADVRCVGWNFLAQRRIVAEAYEVGSPTWTLGSIVEDLVTKYLSADGVTTTNVLAGPEMAERIVFEYCTLSEAFNRLATMAGYDWYIDESKDVHFKQFSIIFTDFELQDNSRNWRYRRIRQSLGEAPYRNVQIIRATSGLAPNKTHTFVGDGASRSFVMPYTVDEQPSIRVDGVAQTVSTVAGSQWLYTPGSRTITQDGGETLLTAGNTVAVQYVTAHGNIVTVTDTDKIADRVAVEGGSGIYEAIEDASDVETEETATLIANGLLQRCGVVPSITEVEILNSWPTPGMTLPFNVGFIDPTQAGSHLIESVTSTHEGGVKWVHRCRLTSGFSLGDWRIAWKRLDERARRVKKPTPQAVVWTSTDAVATGTNVGGKVHAVASGNVKAIVASVDEAPVGHAITGAVKANGAEVGTFTIPAGSTTAEVNTNVSVTRLTKRDKLTVDVDAVGSTTPGSGLTVQLEYEV